MPLLRHGRSCVVETVVRARALLGLAPPCCSLSLSLPSRPCMTDVSPLIDAMARAPPEAATTAASDRARGGGHVWEPSQRLHHLLPTATS